MSHISHNNNNEYSLINVGPLSLSLALSLRFTFFRRVKGYLNFEVTNVTLRKKIYIIFRSTVICDPAENVHGVIIRKEYKM